MPGRLLQLLPSCPFHPRAIAHRAALNKLSFVLPQTFSLSSAYNTHDHEMMDMKWTKIKTLFFNNSVQCALRQKIYPMGQLLWRWWADG